MVPIATEVGVAYVRLLPSMAGFSAAAAKGMGPALTGPSKKAGDQAGQGFISGLGSALQSGGRRISGIGDSLTKGLTVPLLGLGAVAFNASKDFNQGMANVATLIPGNTARVKELSGGVRELAIDMGKSTGDMTEGLYNVISAFGDSSESMSLLEINARAATAGMATTTDAINLTSAVTKGYGDTSQEAVQQASDLALLTVRMGQTTFPELASSIGQVIPIAQNLGVTQEELFGSMATFTGVTGSASEVATQMRAAMQGLQAPTADGAKAIEEAGFASGAAAVEELGLAGAVGILTDAADESGEPLQKFLGQVEGQTFALGLAGAQAEDYETKLGEMADASGATDEAFKEATEGVNEAGFEWDQAKAKANDLMIELGDRLAPAITSALEAAEPLIAGISELATKFDEASPTTQKWIVSLLGITVALGPVMSIFGRLITTIGGVVRGFAAFGRGAATVARGGVKMGAAVGRGTTKIARGGVAAGKGLGRLVSGFRDARAAESAFSGRMGSIGGKMRSGVNAFGRLGVAAGKAATSVVKAGARMAASAAKTAARVTAQIAIQIAKWALLGVQALLHAAKVALAWIISLGPLGLIVAAVIGAVALIVANWDKVSGAFKAAFNWLKENWQKVLAILTGPIGIAVGLIIRHRDKILDALKKAWQWLKDNWQKVLGFITGPIGQAVLFVTRNWNKIQSKFREVKDFIRARVNDIVKLITGIPDRIRSAAKRIGSTIINGIKSGVASVGGFVSDIARSVKNAINSALHLPFTIKGPGPLPDFTIPAFHGGGVFSAGPGQSEGLAMLSDQEGVFTPEQMAALAPVGSAQPAAAELIVGSDGTEIGDAIVWTLANTIRTKHGGDVQVALQGGGR